MNQRYQGRFVIDHSTFSRHKESGNRVHKRDIYDSRMENIDRINSKIRNILQCINTCETEQTEDKINVGRDRSRYLDRSIV